MELEAEEGKALDAVGVNVLGAMKGKILYQVFLKNK